MLEGPGLRLKVKRERSEPYALVAPLREPEQWERLQAVLSAVTDRTFPGVVEALGWELPVSEAASLFRLHAQDLIAAYSSWWSWRTIRKRLNVLRKSQQQHQEAFLASPNRDAQG